jgi:hypothetical protein
MLCHVPLVGSDVSEECIASIIMVTRIGELGMLAVTGTLMMEGTCSSETLVLTTAMQHDIPEDGIFHSHCSENLKFLEVLCGFPQPFWANVNTLN